MNVVIRADASSYIGSGHIMRCLTLAEVIREYGGSVTFICRDFTGNYISFVESKGFEVASLSSEVGDPTKLNDIEWVRANVERDAHVTIDCCSLIGNVDWLISDHYGLDGRWDELLCKHVSKMMVIDDLARAKRSCDLLLNQNYYKNIESTYQKILPDQAELLLGPRYALLRPEFFKLRKLTSIRSGKVQKVIIFLGGNDRHGVIFTILEALQLMENRDFRVLLVLGKNQEHLARIKRLCSFIKDCEVHVQTEFIAELFAQSDLCIGAGGSAMLERFSLGLPTLLISMADNQELGAQYAAEEGLAYYLGKANEMNHERIIDGIEDLLNNSKKLQSISEKCFTISDGRGCDRVFNRMGTILNED